MISISQPIVQLNTLTKMKISVSDLVLFESVSVMVSLFNDDGINE
jgi:hypothetical protein